MPDEPVNPKQTSGDDADLHRRRIITDKQLQGMCAQVANMAKTELRTGRGLHGIIASYIEGEGLHRMRKVEALAIERLGEDWTNSPAAKEMVFSGLALCAKATKPDAFVLCTGGDNYRQNASFDALPREEQERLMDAYHPKHMPEYFRAHDVLMVTAQTPERVCIYVQDMRIPGYLLIGEPEIRFWPQSANVGRLKLF